MHRWAAIDEARAQPLRRIPFVVGGLEVGSVAEDGAEALLALGAPLSIDGTRIELDAALGDLASRSAALHDINAALRERELISGWRDETYPVLAAPGGEALALIERAASRFWGTLTLGAHANGYVAGRDGKPTHLWIARRAWTKPTDPGLLDNLIGGGVPHGQTPRETLLREGDEEAGLASDVTARAVPGRVIALHRALPDCAGLGLQHEHLHAFDLRLPAFVQPFNRDGEVAQLWLATVDEAIEHAACGEMTVDAALVTLDFALRQRLLSPHEHEALARRAAHLWAAA
ncbi:DUF4743 domain-containing protein [Caldimonas sp. KR1-144]|uniref:NUDIX hydrolase n=1 Tax=Caldimonas sp. KR1-144 TaxID=3400911 RepID=UPI003BFD8441